MDLFGQIVSECPPVSTPERLFNWPTPGVNYDAFFFHFLTPFTVSHFDHLPCCTPQPGFGMPSVKHRVLEKLCANLPRLMQSSIKKQRYELFSPAEKFGFGSERGRGVGYL